MNIALIQGPEASLIAAGATSTLIGILVVAALSYIMGYANGVRLERKRRARAYRDSQTFRR